MGYSKSGSYYGLGGKSRTIEWETPPEVFNKLNKEFKFNLDPCTTKRIAKCKRYFTKKEDGLKQNWKGKVFMNPPYGRGIENWVRKAWTEVKKGNAQVVACLIPVRGGNDWFSIYSKYGELRFIRRRIAFGLNGVFSTGPFNSMLLIFRKGWIGHGRFCCWDWDIGVIKNIKDTEKLKRIRKRGVK